MLESFQEPIFDAHIPLVILKTMRFHLDNVISHMYNAKFTVAAGNMRRLEERLGSAKKNCWVFEGIKESIANFSNCRKRCAKSI